MANYPNNRFNRFMQPQLEQNAEGNISASDASYHEIAIYNGVKDKIWQVGAEINNAEDLITLKLFLNDLYMLLLRADKTWKSVEYSVQEKVKRSKMGTASFKYNNQMKKYAKNVKTYISFMTNEPTGLPAQEEYMNIPSQRARLTYLKEESINLISDVTDEWEKLAAKIDFTMPLELREGRDVFFRITTALQIKYTKEQYELYKKVAKRGIEKLAFLFALSRVNMSGHIPCVISGEFNHGKSTTEIIFGLLDIKFTRLLLKTFKPEVWATVKDELKFTTKENIIISRKDPASKNFLHPKRFTPYAIDEATLMAMAQDATTTRFRKLMDAFAQNRKLAPAYYMVYSNFFLMPNALASLMMVWIHKISVNTAEVVIPSTVIQTKEKWDRERIERYAKYPNSFRNNIKFHPSFIMELKTPALKGKRWENYLKKYDKYKEIIETLDENEKRPSKTEAIYKKIDEFINRGVVKVESKGDVANLIKSMLSKTGNLNDNSISALSNELANGYQEWKAEAISENLVGKLNKLLLEKAKG